MKEWWEELAPDRKRLVAGGGVGVVLLAVLYLFVSATPEDDAAPEDLPTDVTNVLTGRSTRELGLDALGNEVREQGEALQALATRLAGQEEAAQRGNREVREALDAVVQGLNALQTDVQRELRDVRNQRPPSPAAAPRGLPAEITPQENVPEIQQPGTVAPEDIIQQNLFDTDPFAPPPLEPSGAAPTGGAGVQPLGSSGQVQVFGAADPSTLALPSPDTVYMPAGAIISGVLLTGADVPTGTMARTDPLPVLMRVKHEAILPNRYRSDVKECFLILAAQGDLSSERALMRSESLSCIRVDGQLIEVTVDGWAVGDDGKLGLRGRLVSRNGSVVAKAAAAGFAQALSEIYRPVRIQSFNTQPGSTALFQAPDGSEALSASGFAGVGGGAAQLAEYYMELADQIVPVVEVDAGRSVDVVLLEGVALTIRET